MEIIFFRKAVDLQGHGTLMGVQRHCHSYDQIGRVKEYKDADRVEAVRCVVDDERVK